MELKSDKYRRRDRKTANERNTIATIHLWHPGDFTSPRLGFPREQDGMVCSRSEKFLREGSSLSSLFVAPPGYAILFKNNAQFDLQCH